MDLGELALHGGKPVREKLLPYGRHSIDEDDLAAVAEVLRSDWITTGPKVTEFEEAFAAFVGARHAVSLSSGTAALHSAAHAIGLGPGDEAVTTPLTFCATANCVLYEDATPIFADIQPDTLNLDPKTVEERIGPRTRAVLPVDFGGQPAQLDAIHELAERNGSYVIEDASHALGAEYRGRLVGSISALTVFSFHPVKHVAAGEGGIVTTDDAELAQRMRRFRSHGIESEPRKRQARGEWEYAMTELGYNYRLSDIACALALSQLGKLPRNLDRRREIAARYTERFANVPGLRIPAVRNDTRPAWHLYPILLNLEALTAGRQEIFRALHAEGLGVNVHYIPVHLHPYYRSRLGTGPGDYPLAEDAYARLLSLPMFHSMTDQDITDTINAVEKVMAHYHRPTPD